MVLIAAAFVATRGARESGAASGTAETSAAPSAKVPAPGRADESPSPEGGAGAAAPPERSVPRGQPATDKGAPGTKRASISPAAPKEKGASVGLPVSLARVLARDDVALLFFRQRRGADDEAVSDAVRFVQRRAGRRVAVFTDRVENLADYRLVIGGLGVSQAPSVVIVGANKRAKLVEGFVDGETLLQYVTDTLR
jgi:hypothetical protein